MTANRATATEIIDRIYDRAPGLAGRVASVVIEARRRRVAENATSVIKARDILTEAEAAGLIRFFTAENGHLWMERND